MMKIIYLNSTMNLTPTNDRDRDDDVSLNSQRSEKKSSNRQNRSATPSSSTSKSSQEEFLLSVQRSKIGEISLLKDLYSSIEQENLRGIPLIYLGAEKFTRIRIDWTRTSFPLSSSQIESIIDLISHRPSFVREIAQISPLNHYRRLAQTIQGRLFFDGENHRAAEHQCHRKDFQENSSRKFQIDDLIAMHRREFHLIQYNACYDQRFHNLVASLHPIYDFQSN